jgi:hypothetical protein
MRKALDKEREKIKKKLDAGAGRLNWRVLYRWVTYRIVTTESNRNGTEENFASSYEDDNVSNFFFLRPSLFLPRTLFYISN